MKYPEFKNNNTFSELHDGLNEIDLLRKFSSNLKTIHYLTTSHYADFNSLISEYILAGTKIFSMEFGIVSNIVEDEYTVLDVISPGNVLSPGDTFDLEGTYCREVVNSQKVIGLPHVGAIKEMRGHPVYQNMKLESYISAPIYKEDVIYGTLNFSSTEVREYGFSEYERELISMLAHSIGTYLSLRDKEEKLQSANKRIRTLTGYLAHDLRSPLGNIFSLAELLPEMTEEESIEMINEIKEISNKAMEIVNTVLEAAIIGEGKLSLDKRKYLLGDIISESINDFKTYSNNSNLSIEENIEEALVFIDKERIHQVFTNLLSNSLKYSKENSIIYISIINKEKGVEFSMKNSIKDNNKVNNIGRSSEEKSYGFGLEIVREILKLHSSELLIDIKDEEFTASFVLEY
ncbi:GAF domain-containing protein [Halobacteriovorax sp.]|uniref:GAF domain-containing sensor histidine kinase n=1 Tax=Halobacteriovorax sp. TaxID=2020862 RepID=UPI00356413B7